MKNRFLGQKLTFFNFLKISKKGSKFDVFFVPFGVQNRPKTTKNRVFGTTAEFQSVLKSEPFWVPHQGRGAVFSSERVFDVFLQRDFNRFWPFLKIFSARGVQNTPPKRGSKTGPKHPPSRGGQKVIKKGSKSIIF